MRGSFSAGQLVRTLAVGLLVLAFMSVRAGDASVNTTVLPANSDSTIRQNQPTRNFGVAPTIDVRSRTGQNRRGVIAFDLSSIPASATIERASLRLYLNTIPGGGVPRTYGVHRVANSWLEGTGNGAVNSPAINGVTWWERQYGDNAWTGTGAWDWLAPGGDFAAAPTDSTATLPAAGWMSWDVIADVNAWYTGFASNYGWLIKDAAENSGPVREGLFSSRENGDPALAPALDVTYLRAASAVSTTSVQAGSVMPMKVSLANTGGAGGDQVRQVTFTIPGGWGDIPTTTAGYVIVASGGKVWNVTGLPAGPDGTQTAMATAATDLDDLADAETVEINFNVRAPWATGDSRWAVTAIGAAGGAHPTPDWTVNVYAGPLDLTPSVDTSFTLSLSGVDATATGSLGLLEVRDPRGTGGGWNVVLAATDFVLAGNPTETIPATVFSVPVAPPVTVISGNTPPSTAAGSLAGVGLTVLNAAAGSGMGHYQVTPDLQLIVPAQAYSGIYESTITETIVGG